jgi:hypothetical protein
LGASTVWWFYHIILASGVLEVGLRLSFNSGEIYHAITVKLADNFFSMLICPCGLWQVREASALSRLHERCARDIRSRERRKYEYIV